jgi:hypothetical protein
MICSCQSYLFYIGASASFPSGVDSESKNEEGLVFEVLLVSLVLCFHVLE